MASTDGWHARALKAYRRRLEAAGRPSDTIHTSHEDGNIAFFYGERSWGPHRWNRAAQPDLICLSSSRSVDLACEVEQTESPKKILGDILAIYASAWGIVPSVGSNGRTEIALARRPIVAFVLRKDKLEKKGSSKAKQIRGLLAKLYQMELIGDVEVWLANGTSGQLDAQPLYSVASH